MSRTRITRLDTLETLVLDADPARSVNPSVVVPEHPVDSEFNVSDNSQRELKEFSISGIVSKTPLTTRGTALSEESRLQQAVRFLDRAAMKKLRVTTERLGRREPARLTEYPQDIDKVNNLKIDLSFRIVREAESESVPIPPEQTSDPQLASPQDKGKQVKDTVPASELFVPEPQQQDTDFAQQFSQAEDTDQQALESNGFDLLPEL